mgnify:CR=1 FL=1
MELRILLKNLKKNLKWLVFSSVIFLALGVLIYYAFPAKYVAVGSFYVTRKVNSASESSFFTYEGYYANQTARSFAETVFGLFESRDSLSKALSNLNFVVTDGLLRRTARLISVKKPAPAVILLEVKGDSPVAARALWKEVSQVVILASDEINAAYGDHALKITPLRNDPVIQREYRNVYLNAVIGFVFGIGLFVFVESLKIYLKDNHS